ncbi:hypothetical protein [Haloferax sp. DFSO60]|uniref:hypothetical protein n=1 Tax=Haloferax sp. DFSO60 TaxID=3388652 RepID=UPI00397E1A4F
MQFIVRLTHSPDNCWARPEHKGKASELHDRLETAEESFGVTVHNAFVAPNEHTFYLVLEAESFEGIVGLLSPPILQDHEADVIPVTSIAGGMEATGVE